MSNVFYTSDLHLGHARVAEIRGFETVEAHDAWMTAMWRTYIGPRDVVFVLGDISVRDHDKALALLADLPGRKHLISGNHDATHPLNHNGLSKWMPRYLEVFETVMQSRVRKINNVYTYLSHYPYASWGDGPAREGSRHEEWRFPEMERPLLHGHTHGTEREHGYMMHVGVDAWGRPVPEEWVAQWLNRHRQPGQAWVDDTGIKPWNHPFSVEKPIVCHECKAGRMPLAQVTVKGRKMLCPSCAA